MAEYEWMRQAECLDVLDEMLVLLGDLEGR